MCKGPWNTGAERGYAAKALAQRGRVRTIHIAKGNGVARSSIEEKPKASPHMHGTGFQLTLAHLRQRFGASYIVTAGNWP